MEDKYCFIADACILDEYDCEIDNYFLGNELNLNVEGAMTDILQDSVTQKNDNVLYRIWMIPYEVTEDGIEEDVSKAELLYSNIRTHTAKVTL